MGYLTVEQMETTVADLKKEVSNEKKLLKQLNNSAGLIAKKTEKKNMEAMIKSHTKSLEKLNTELQKSKEQLKKLKRDQDDSFEEPTIVEREMMNDKDLAPTVKRKRRIIRKSK